MMFANLKEYLRDWFQTGGSYLLIAAVFFIVALILYEIDDWAKTLWANPNEVQKLILLVTAQYKTVAYIAVLFVVVSFVFPPFYKVFDKIVIARLVAAFDQGFTSLTVALQDGVRQALGSFDADRRRQAIIQLIETSTSLTATDLAEIGKIGLTRSYGFERRLSDLERNYMEFIGGGFLDTFLRPSNGAGH